MAADPTGRPPSKFPCIYWDGLNCAATSKYDQSEISCYNNGNCDGFGTCRGCSKYDQGGLKVDNSDGQGGLTQTPLNLQIYNLRAKIAKCCYWSGSPSSFSKNFVKTDTSIGIASIIDDENNLNIELNVTGGSLDDFPPSGRLLAKREGLDPDGNPYINVSVIYTAKSDSGFTGVRLSPHYTVGGENSGSLVINNAYTLYLAEVKARPVFKIVGAVLDEEKGEEETHCTLSDAAPWQEGLTEDNPSAYGCNGAKPECPYYTGPRFTEVVDSKMDTGDRVTAKQIMELRYYSQDWRSIADDAFSKPRDLWEDLFQDPDIWAWARDTTTTPVGPVRTPGPGRFDPTTGKPLIQKVSVSSFESDAPTITVGQPQVPEDGTPVVGGVPVYPTLVKQIFDITPGPRVLFPQNTSPSNPFVKRSFTEAERFLYIAFDAMTDNEVVAINLTKHPQGSLHSEDFIRQVRASNPEDVSTPFISGLPGSTVSVELEYGDTRRTLNHIRIFVDTGVGEEDDLDSDQAPGSFDPLQTEFPSLPNGKRRYITADVYIEHVFHHAHVAQTYFNDYYGHKMIDPWVNHFTQMDLGGKIFDLTTNCTLDKVLWNTIASDGKKTMYAIETQKVVNTASDDSLLTWSSLGCAYILVEFLDKNINRVFPWKAWGKDSKDEDLYVILDRAQNPNLLDGEPTSVEFELSLASTQGTALPANIAIFRPKDGLGIRPPDPAYDTLRVRYAYTEYKQGPLPDADIPKLKFPADATKIIESMPYGVSFDTQSFDIEGTFLRVGNSKLYSCEDVLGDCYTQKALANERLARSVFLAGGVGEENIKSHTQMINECALEFNAKHQGKVFEDGDPVTYNSTVTRLQNLHLREGSQHYLFVFKDEEGRPIGVKNEGFLTQSAIVQARDVEIRYKWGGQAQHHPNHHSMFMFARSYSPLTTTTNRLVYLVQVYDPFCGDHAATDGGTLFRAFDLAIDRHGPLWYPYKRCMNPTYHSDSSFFDNVVHYEDTVEGFSDNKRRDYWERMRVWDKYMPVVMDYIPQLGCFWSERTTTLYVSPPYTFLGYTKIRSSHPFGYYSTDRESIRVSRHWEKRNLEFNAEVYTQEQDGTGFSIDLDPAYAAALYDSEGNLREGEDLETPVWVHINDSIGIVSVATEALTHPFNHLLLERVGSHSFNEQFNSSQKYDLRDVLEERDYTSTLLRSEDGSKVYMADGTELNVVSSGIASQVFDPGKDIRIVFKKDSTAGKIGWCWLSEPDQPVRGDNPITGLYISNPPMLFKKNLVSSTCTTEGFHNIQYTAPVFDTEGAVSSYASLSMDGGPPVYIDLDGNLFVTASSPYNADNHTSSDYSFVLHGTGPGGVGIIADNRGLQRFEVDGRKFATYAGVVSNLYFDVNELPYEVHDVRTLPNVLDLATSLNDIENEYTPIHENYTRALTTGMTSLAGNYYVESVDITFIYGDDYDIPTISLMGIVYSTGSVTALAAPTQYIDGSAFARGTRKTVTISVKERLAAFQLSLGARKTGKSLNVTNIVVNVRKPVNRREEVFISAPRVHISTAETGTHHPAELEFYFQRSYPDWAKSFLAGTLSLGDVGQDITPLAGVEVKYTGRRVKDMIPTFDFTDPINNRFPYNNINIASIPGYTVESSSLGDYKYINSAIQTSSKGWTMYTGPHEQDPGSSLTHKNSYDGLRPFEEVQETLYRDAGALLGDKLAVFQSFWHPKEKEFFAKSGVDLDAVQWTLRMASTVAPIEKVFRHENYGCAPEATNEYVDGLVHRLENWQAKGVFHYQCDPRFNYRCYTVLMNKCQAYLFEEYGSANYVDSDVLGRFNYVFALPPRAYTSYVAAGLIDKNYIGGVFGGFNPTSVLQASFSQIPSFFSLPAQTAGIIVPPKGPGEFQ